VRTHPDPGSPPVFFFPYQTHKTDALPGVSTPQNAPENAVTRAKRGEKYVDPV